MKMNEQCAIASTLFRNDTLFVVAVDDDKITNKRALVKHKTCIYSLYRMKSLSKENANLESPRYIAYTYT